MALFDQAAKDYDSWYNDPVGKYVDDAEMPCMLKMLGDVWGKRILDIGCGTGHLSEELCKRGAQVIGIDISEGMLEVAKKKRDKKELDIEYLYMDAFELRFDEPFDIICSMAAFEFIDDMESIFKSMNTVLKEDGTIVIGTIQNGGAWADMYSSEAFSETVFAESCFKSLADFQAVEGFQVDASTQCLYVPPALEPTAYTMEQEQLLCQNDGLGGFLCVKMKKS